MTALKKNHGLPVRGDVSSTEGDVHSGVGQLGDPTLVKDMNELYHTMTTTSSPPPRQDQRRAFAKTKPEAPLRMRETKS